MWQVPARDLEVKDGAVDNFQQGMLWSTQAWHPIQAGVGGSGIRGVVRESFRKWVMSLLNSEGFDGVNQGKESGENENIPGRTNGIWAQRLVFLKGGAIGSFRGQMYLYVTVPRTGGCLASLPLGTKYQQYLPPLHPQYTINMTAPNAPSHLHAPPLHQRVWCHFLGENHC